MDKLDDWIKGLSSIKKIEFNEAQELYKIFLNTKNIEERKEILNKIIVGTLYVVCDYIRNNCFDLFVSSSFDMDDVISSFNEIWVKKIYEGKLLNVKTYSELIDQKFLDDVYDSLGGDKVFITNIFGITVDDFVKFFARYIELKNMNSQDLIEKDINIKYPPEDYFKVLFENDDKYRFVKYYNKENKRKNLIKFIPIFERIYESLNYDENVKLDLSADKIRKYFKFMISSYMYSPLKEKLAYNMDNTMVSHIDNEMLRKKVDSIIKDNQKREIIHERYGLDKEGPLTLQEIAEKHHVYPQTVHQIEKKALAALKHDKNICEFKR